MFDIICNDGLVLLVLAAAWCDSGRAGVLRGACALSLSEHVPVDVLCVVQSVHICTHTHTHAALFGSWGKATLAQCMKELGDCL